MELLFPIVYGSVYKINVKFHQSDEKLNES